MKTIAFAFFSLVLLYSCSPKIAPDTNWAEGNWILIELKEVPVQISGNSWKDAHIDFTPSARTFGGFGGCNKIDGTYTIDKSKIKFNLSATLLAACPDVPFETTFLAQLKEVNNYTLTDDVMILKNGKNTVIKLRRK
jgi:heat shock protein HslJ